jgi:hypothetical protein
MKNLIFFLLIAFVFISCDKLDEPEILGTYTHSPQGCDTATDPFMGCRSILVLSAGGVADVLYGGDIVSRTSYKIRGQRIEIGKSDQSGLELSYRRLNDGSLREKRDGSIWLKQE